ncbi:hypothetical protein BX616_004320 [Lobosporangium transversale]|uniref:Pentacotripeptide-repeat region of PRORP domain-containing protein n=1 Tax=Lobosporangium transversale TaxID=64571 RepID=A0A1Y2GZK3_9FUNG|nr:hypothetical protein BCR41DRAFT_418748 [Lobosporangium transversale]KAF9916213.1 hypothetical protein BX616_004320 [Lobosporangium transversale]ORZ27737.1 hypothetical protein BCR41DRAFT_418748 [Lobosporangium transversale]|eukprot:XP_021885440.1 hypothetical protein BCR41DRAFT_418748 [Lobosporangium transversale]
MMNLKTTAMLGNITRQGVSRQFMPLGNTKNSVLTLSQRTAAQGGNVSAANAPSNPVRSFSSTQANRDSNNNSAAVTGAYQFHGYNAAASSHFSTNSPLGSLSLSTSHQRFQGPLTANVNFRKDFNKSATNNNGSKPVIPKYSEISSDAWEAISGQDARTVFSYLQKMQHEGLYADFVLSSRIVAQFLDMNSPKDAEKALSMLVDCHQNQGRGMTTSHKTFYASLAKDIANHSSDFSQALSLAKLLERHGLLASSGFADGALRTYRNFKTNAGLDAVKTLINVNDIETLLSLQSSLKTINRYKHLIEILLDAKEMNIIPSQEMCSQVSLSFMKLNDYTGQLAWDTAVQEIYPGYRPTVPEDLEQELSEIGSVSGSTTPSSYYSNNSSRSSSISSQGSATSPRNNNSNANDPSEAIIRACRLGYATTAIESINKMISQNQLPSAQAIADTIQVCAKREKERATDYKRLFALAEQSLASITDVSQRRTAEYEIYNAMLVANATLGDMTSAKKNYDDIVKLGQFPDATGYATLLIATTTGAVDEAHDALRILEEVKRHNIKPNIFFYNVVIGKLSRGRKIERVLEVYEEMVQHNIRPNAITYGTLISACTRVGSEDMAKNLFQEMVNAPNYHARHGPHNAMIQFYVRQKKDRQSALFYYEDMLQRRLVPTEHTYTLLVEAFACIQPYDLTEANCLIQSLKRGPVRATEAHYGALIHAYGVEHRDVSAAETAFNNMRAAGIVPKGPAYQSLIESFITNNQVSRAVQVRNELLKTGQPSSAYIENTLIRGYGIEKNIFKAEQVFEAMMDPSAANATSTGKNNNVIIKEPSTYQSMVTAYLDNGMVEKARETLKRMKEQHYPDLVVKPVEEAILAATATTHGAKNSHHHHHHHQHHNNTI